jgi:hypothetical protein
VNISKGISEVKHVDGVHGKEEKEKGRKKNPPGTRSLNARRKYDTKIAKKDHFLGLNSCLSHTQVIHVKA